MIAFRFEVEPLGPAHRAVLSSDIGPGLVHAELHEPLAALQIGEDRGLEARTRPQTKGGGNHVQILERSLLGGRFLPREDHQCGDERKKHQAERDDDRDP